ncbi:hypothetical protein EIN_381980 [Entamoeba invadens IP1]|uniref:Putative nitroreductase TM1586 domain-containing protein n=1 Tax=Entamoeba invadens IP1 TaxID=370355 RepID=A0A0A1U0Z1_ENTIV|nr:hypothetical protein EIN_381980 [Entamoeba invadens IP1]ELP87674.1 hypothetical protein EIN_381980 [Entamoeba invadens IP1]|eukprot:XP_004254445.1 hypothetical protein EIN_381980 [Entamoeba invadens IP1]
MQICTSDGRFQFIPYVWVHHGLEVLDLRCDEKNNRNSDFSYGYLMHLIILECTRLGLKTVWLGGTFTTSFFTAIQYNSSTDYIPCVSPVGNSGNGSELICIMACSRKRKELNDYLHWICGDQIQQGERTRDVHV